MPRHALQHSHTCLHLFTSTHSQNKVSLCPHRDIFTCTDITSGRVSQATQPETGRAACPPGESGRTQATCIFLPAQAQTGWAPLRESPSPSEQRAVSQSFCWCSGAQAERQPVGLLCVLSTHSLFCMCRCCELNLQQPGTQTGTEDRGHFSCVQQEQKW